MRFSCDGMLAMTNAPRPQEGSAACAYYSRSVASVPSAAVPGGGRDGGADGPPRARRLALSTAFFSFATGLSRVAGLIREVVAASLFGVTGPMSAFTVAFAVPNLIRAL